MSTDVESPDRQAEEAFFERGLLEERATLEALSRRPPEPVRPRRGARARAVTAALTVGLLGAGTFATVQTVVVRAARRPATRIVAVAAPREPTTQPAPADIAPPPAAPEVSAPPSPVRTTTEPPISACRAAIAAKRYGEMLTACAAAVSSDGEGAGLALRVAGIELGRGRASSAFAWAQRSVNVDPNLAEAYVIIGSVDQDSGRLAAARTAYARYLALAPRGRYAADLRAILRQH